MKNRSFTVCLALSLTAASAALAQMRPLNPQPAQPAAPTAPAASSSCATPAPNAEFTPFMLSLVSPLEAPTRDFDVTGLRLSIIYGECQNFAGLDIGLISRTRGVATGVQISAIATIVDGDAIGFQPGLVNIVKGECDGFQIGAANYVNNGQAFQIGVYNGAQHIEGCQIGLINTARTMSGIEIGLVNVIQDKDAPFLPIINGYF
jgi:hypothetical protein